MVVLIVEDNPAMRRVIRTFIADVADSVEVAECGDGASALQAYEQNRPDWVLMDIRLGAVNGIEASREIRARYPEARIVVVTNYDDSELREAAASAGACAYVLKENLIDLHDILSGAVSPNAARAGSACLDS